MALVSATSSPAIPASVLRAATGTSIGLLAAKRAASTRRHYWSYRCGKLKGFGGRSPYQYRSWYPKLLRYRSSESSGVGGKPGAASQSPKHDSEGKQEKTEETRDGYISPWEPFREIRTMMKQMAKNNPDALKTWFEKGPFQSVFGRQGERAFYPFYQSRQEYWKRQREITEEFKSMFKDYDRHLKSWYARENTSERKPTVNPSSTVETSKDPSKAESLKSSPGAETLDTSSTAKAPENASRVTNATETKYAAQLTEEFIDPITMRRVVRTIQQPPIKVRERTMLASDSKPDSDESVQIPVKKYIRSTPVSDLNKQEIEALSSKQTKKEVPLSGFAAQPWLVREGFSGRTPTIKEKPKPRIDFLSPATKAAVTMPTQSKPDQPSQLGKIQSSLDRLHEKTRQAAPKAADTSATASSTKSEALAPKISAVSPRTEFSMLKPSEKPRLQYFEQEKRDEDIDLLRASDVRAASGHVKTKSKSPTPEEAQLRREKLSKDFTRVQESINKPLVDEFIRAVYSDKPQEAPLLDYWRASVQNVGLQKYKGLVKQLKNAADDMASRIKLDTKQLQKAHQGARIEVGGGTSLGRYLNANRVGEAVEKTVAIFKSWNNELLERPGQEAKQSADLESAFKQLEAALDAYKVELRRQIMAVPPPPPKVSVKQQAADQALAKEVKQQKAAMQAYEDRPRKQVETKSPSFLWNENLKLVEEHERQHQLHKKQAQKQRDKKLVYEIKDIYEQEYGTITTDHKQRVKEVPAPKVPKAVNEASEIGTPITHDWYSADKHTTETEPARTAKSNQPLAEQPRVAEPVSDVSVEPQANLEKANEPSSSIAEATKAPTETYRILSYDEFSGSVVAATAKSSLSSSGPLKTPAQIFMELERPQSFVQQMELLQKSGFELIDGGAKMLIFHQIAPSTTQSVSQPTPASSASAAEPTLPSPESTTLQPDTSAYSFASSTHGSPTPLPGSHDPRADPNSPHIRYPGPHHTPESSPSTERKFYDEHQFRVRREEPVYSGGTAKYGSGRWHESARRQGRRERRERRKRRLFEGFWAAVGRAVGSGLVVLVGVYLLGLAAEWRREKRVREGVDGEGKGKGEGEARSVKANFEEAGKGW